VCPVRRLHPRLVAIDGRRLAWQHRVTRRSGGTICADLYVTDKKGTCKRAGGRAGRTGIGNARMRVWFHNVFSNYACAQAVLQTCHTA
jgi:hypothetical protein